MTQISRVIVRMTPVDTRNSATFARQQIDHTGLTIHLAVADSSTWKSYLVIGAPRNPRTMSTTIILN